MLKASFVKYPLAFKKPSGTSRGILTKKNSWLLKIFDDANPAVFGLGEASIIEGLSIDLPSQMEDMLDWVVRHITQPYDAIMAHLTDFPSILMAVEMAFLDLKNGGNRIWFKSPLTKQDQPIKINGLIWMGDKDFMLQQIEDKLQLGFSCLKMKIGAINFQQEIAILRSIRQRYDEHDLELRVDANGAFSTEEAPDKLNQLASLDLHSIEQPIQQNQISAMAELCAATPLPIALDEELIGVRTPQDKKTLLETINPQYIILKPSLLGGFSATYEWIELAGEMSIPWWITSALESNVGLTAIAQFTSQFYNPLPQGLGTGQLYTNNIPCPLQLKGEMLFHDSSLSWELPNF
ncbi:o-succinylbenzoate synthase [Parvicella tangerina]|uniref:L-Ala-D/L-Glu epimerase n=1 Tax=Parvicella tangerina TaxID=2829795 RepID=A0A916JPW7_9FLAO|nr:o-succinylbenzoate synthase [Parvicella tangerina]CAG5086692.1 L-Ala-D/L-Glu epimerase [Parvicella tangerina]